MSKQTELVGLARTTNLDEVNLAYGAGALSNRNLLINGSFQVAQRGTSITAGASNTYTLDRWIGRDGIVQRSTDVPSGKGFKNSAFYDNAGVRPSICMRQIIEDANTLLNGQDVTISFWVKTSVTTAIGIDIHDVYSSGYTLNCPANTWTYQTYTATNVDTSLFPDYWGGPHAHIDFNFGTDYPDVYITGVQLEVGDTATPFEHRSFGQELSLCQRYYWSETGTGDSLTTTYATLYSTSYAMCLVDLPVTMRAVPTVSAGSYTSTVLANYHSQNRIQIYLNTTAASVNDLKADAEI
jgi:hypothetical protein